jgi:hypothetical protein
LTGDKLGRKVSLIAVVNANMSIDIKKGCFFRRVAVPMVYEQMVKLLRLLLAGKQLDLIPKASYFGYTVKPYYFADLTRFALFKLFWIFDAGQGHKSQGKDNRF